MKPLFLQIHLGLGDAIILNSAIRWLAQQHPLIILPVKPHNLQSVTFMLRDVRNVTLLPVKDDHVMLAYGYCHAGNVVRIGSTGPNFNGQAWDESMYQQIGLGFQNRWDMWKVERDAPAEAEMTTINPLMFVHDDKPRGMVIRDEFLTKPFPLITRTDTIFHWWPLIEQAEEIHCIPSSFSVFIDSIDLPKNPKLFLHAYTRPGEPLATYRKEWKILK